MATDREGFQKNSMQDAPTEFPLDVNNMLDWNLWEQSWNRSIKWQLEDIF